MASSTSQPLLRVGQVLPGKHWQYKLTKRLPNFTWSLNDVFRAEILGDTFRRAPKWAAIKAARSSMQEPLINERNEYMQPHVSSCRSIRPLLEVITTVKDEAISAKSNKSIWHPPPYLVFAWMEGNLDEIAKTHMKDLALFEAVVTGILQALVPFELNNRVHADLMHKNILVNCPQPGKYEVVLGDLGCATYNGFDEEPLGPFGTCAPEVFEGKGYYHGSDVWALGMTLLELFNMDALIYKLPPGSHYVEAVMIAQLMWMYPNWMPEPVEGAIYKDMPLKKMFAKASKLKPLLPTASLEQQFKDMDVAKEMKDMLRVLLSLELEKRSSASGILQSPEYVALRKAAHN